MTLHKLWLLFAQSVAALAVLAAALFALDRLAPGLLPFDGDAVTIREVANGGSARPISTYADAAKKSQPSVVNVSTSKQVRVQRNPLMDDPIFRRFFGDRFANDNRPQRVSNLGSGVIVSHDGFILTNHHVVEAADEIQVALSNGITLDAEVVGTDPDTDLAVLKVKRKGLPAITFAKPESQQVGDVVLAIGNPFGVGQTVTMGIISALGRNHLGIGFAIPVSIAREVMREIISHGTVTRGWVGIEVQEITPEIAESFDLKSTSGALIAGVLRTGPADRAGIRPGDILLAVGDKKVTDSSSLSNLIASLPPGKVVQLHMQREQTEMQLMVTVEKRPPMRQPAQE